MPSLLFVAPLDLGEAVLATGALHFAAASMDGAEITVVCNADARELYRATPELKRIEVRAGIEPWLPLARQSLLRPFDLAIDLSGTSASYTVRARRRVRRSPPRLMCHYAEEMSAQLGAPRPLAPHIGLDQRARDAAVAALPGAGLTLVLAPGGYSAAKRWSPENFAAVARRLVGDDLAGAQTLVLGAAARDGERARAIVASLEADGVAARTAADMDLLAAAAFLERATLCIGNDNALTHIAAAMGAPTLTLFGPTDERVRAPYGPRARTLRGMSFEDAAAALDADAPMAHLSIDAVEAAARDLLHAGGLR